MTPYRGPGSSIEPWSQSGGGALATTQPPPLRKIHRLMRGRYVIAFLLAVICGGVGGAIGFFSQKPDYKSVGVIEIDPVVPDWDKVERVMLMYTQHMYTQVAQLQGERLIRLAIEHPDWKRETRNTPRSADPTAEVQDFSRNLKVEFVKGTQLIQVTFQHAKPTAAQAAVKAVLETYDKRFAQQENNNAAVQRREWEHKREDANAAIRDDKAKLDEMAAEYGDDLQSILARRWDDIERYKNDYLMRDRAYQEQLRRGDQVSPPTVEEISLGSAQLQKFIALRDTAEIEVRSLENRAGANNPQLVSKRSDLTSLNQQIDAYAKDWRKRYRGYLTSPDGKMTPIPANLDLMKDEVAKSLQFYEQQKAEATKLQQRSAAMKNLKDRIQKNEEQVKFAETKLEQLRFNSEMVKPVNIISYGDTAITAVDSRFKFGFVGLVAGGSMPVMLMMLIGLMDHRYRYSDETGPEMTGITLLGILPNLPDRLSDPEQAAIAAHCVHQIRTMLQINGGPEERRVFAVTSASPGDGKTSLTLALGLSYAACGTRTLLIDCDLVGAGLTTRMNVNSGEGILEAVANRSLLPYVRGTDIADVSILPVGAAGGHHASTLSPAALRRLLDEAKQNYDTILIDTGPILGSIEASLVCAAADGVVLAVSRGQQRPLVERSLGHLNSIAAHLAGVVFNRAQANDFERSISGVSLRSAVGAATAGSGNGRGTARHDNVGPVARSVTSHIKD